MRLSPRALAVGREVPHLLITTIALFLIMATVFPEISLPMVSLALVVLLVGLAPLIRPEIGLHVLVVNAMAGGWR